MKAEGASGVCRESPLRPAVPAPLFHFSYWLGKEMVGSGEDSPPRPGDPALLLFSGERTGEEVVVGA